MGKGRKPELSDWFQSEECERIIELSKQGYSIKRIAEITGVKYSRVTYVRRLKGFKSDRPFGTDGIKYSDNELVGNMDETIKKQYTEEVALKLKGFGYTFLGFYRYQKQGYKVVLVKCDTCGEPFTRGVNFFPSACPWCYERKQKLARQQEEECRRRKAELLERQKQATIKRKEAKKKEQQYKRLNEKHICKECGKEFTLKEFGEKEHVDVTNYGGVLYCSLACRRLVDKRRTRKYNVTRGNHKLRSIKYDTDFDKNVNLDELIKRNGLRCAICGGMCDTNDKEIINGTVICGNNYPSIDHIKPMSKGGSHTWDNVQVAHRICNTMKGSKVVA